MRQSLSQWHSRILRPLAALRRRPTAPADPRPHHPERVWLVTVAAVRLSVRARTAGEARAVAKRELGIPRKGRLPVGAGVKRV